MSNEYYEVVSECFRNYKEAVLEQAEHPEYENYDHRLSLTERQLEDAIEDMVRTRILKDIESYIKMELTL